MSAWSASIAATRSISPAPAASTSRATDLLGQGRDRGRGARGHRARSSSSTASRRAISSASTNGSSASASTRSSAQIVEDEDGRKALSTTASCSRRSSPRTTLGRARRRDTSTSSSPLAKSADAQARGVMSIMSLARDRPDRPTSRGAGRRRGRRRRGDRRVPHRRRPGLRLEDRCPHKGGPLSQGIVHGATVTCPLHNWVISLETGGAQGARRGLHADHPGEGRRRASSAREAAAAHPRPERVTGAVRTTCPYCGVGCGVVPNAGDGRRHRARRPMHPANRGQALLEGHRAWRDHRPGRPAAPSDDRRQGGRLGRGARSGRPAASPRRSPRMARTASPSTSPGQLLTEDYYVANKLMKGFIGSANIDTNSRLCMSTSVAGHRRAFGEDVVPATTRISSGPTWSCWSARTPPGAIPVVYQRIGGQGRAARASS